MNYKTVFLMMLMGIVGVVNAQSEVKTFRVHFQSDEYILDQSDQKILDEILRQKETGTYCEVVVKAHTDRDAGVQYNQELSEKRADAVSKYLCTQGLREQQIARFAYGEIKPVKSNATRAGKAENRRVDIDLHTYRYANLNEFTKIIGGETKQVFVIKPDQANTVQAKNGMVVKIAASALETEDGKPLDRSEVKMELEEFFKSADFATQQLSTIADGKLLETGGMFSIKVLQNGKELRLKEGKNMQVELPAENVQNNMQVFLPVQNANGITEWKSAGQAFELKPKKEVILPHACVDSKKLQSYKVPVMYTELAKTGYLYQALKYPQKPFEPKRPQALRLADRDALFKWYQQWILPDNIMDKELEKENQRRQLAHQKWVIRYEQRLQHYSKALERYKIDSAAFETSELENFRNWLNACEVQMVTAKRYIETVNFNRSIDKFSVLSEQKKLTSLNPKGLFISMSAPSRYQRMLLGNYELTLGYINKLKGMSLVEALAWRGNKQGRIFIGSTERERPYLYRLYYRNDFASEQLKNDESFAAIFDDAQLEIMKKREKMGLLNNKDIAQIYSASLNQFGLVNCDRFNSTPPNMMADIKIQYSGEARISFFVPSINSYVYAYHDKEKGYNLKLPIGKEVKMVVLGFNPNGEPVYEARNLTISGNTTLEAAPKASTIYDIRKSLAGI